MARRGIVLFCLAALLSSCSSAPTGNSSSCFEQSEASSVQTKELFFPTDVDEPGTSTGVDAFIGYSPYRITHMYVGEGVEEEITGYTYNEKYCTVDSLGRITPKAAGSSYVYAVTKSGRHPVRVNVKAGESFRNHIRESAAIMQQKFQDRGAKKNAAVFLGDSFFDPRGFWEESNFYSAFSGKNVFLTGIGTAKTNDWMTIKQENIFAYQPKALFVNLGINNLINAGDNGKTLAAKLMTLFEEWHYMKNDMPIYYYGIIKTANETWNQQSKISNQLIREFASKTDYLTYLDIPSVLNPTISSYLKPDGLHPNDAAYAQYAALAKEVL